MIKKKKKSKIEMKEFRHTRHKRAVLKHIKKIECGVAVLSVKALQFNFNAKLTLGCCIILLLHVK